MQMYLSISPRCKIDGMNDQTIHLPLHRTLHIPALGALIEGCSTRHNSSVADELLGHIGHLDVLPAFVHGTSFFLQLLR